MEYMDAGSLDKLEVGGIPEGVLGRIAGSMVRGLKFLKDEMQIIHRGEFLVRSLVLLVFSAVYMGFAGLFSFLDRGYGLALGLLCRSFSFAVSSLDGRFVLRKEGMQIVGYSRLALASCLPYLDF